jgi:glycosyltransferase involved in cell wall biosynthesis
MMKEHLLRLKSKPHTLPLLIVFVAITIGQAATLLQHPLAAPYPDSVDYISLAHGILASPKDLINPVRTPGYPFFLATIFRFVGTDHLGKVVVVQALVAVLAVLECYVLAFRLAHRRWLACAITSAIGLNLYILGWERTILTEALSWWSLITLFLCYERFIRRPGLAWGASVAFFSFVAIMIRPFNLFIPSLLLFMALLKVLRSHELRLYWKGMGAAVALLCVCLVSYMGLNASLNGFFGVSDIINADYLGKVMEYHMQDLPVPPRYAGIQADVNATVKAGDVYYWDVYNLYPSKTAYYAHDWRFSASYATYLILHNPGTFLVDSIPDLYTSWLGPASFYPSYDLGPSLPNYTYDFGAVVVHKLMDLSAIELDLYLLLPLLLIGLGVWVWRHPHDVERFILLVLGLMVVGAICLAVMNFPEFYRTRSPVDWAMILLGSIVVSEVLASVGRRKRQPLSISLSQKADLLGIPVNQLQTGADNLLSRSNRSHPQNIVEVSSQQYTGGAGQIENNPSTPEISIVLPCLNEEEAIGACIDTIKQIIADQNLNAEILVCDNASTDRSAEIAREHGARVTYQPVRGYGNAYLKGFAEASGKYIVMADADNTYDFHEIPAFVQPLRQGYDLVMGNRFSGRMAKGAMTWSHRYIGNPILSGLLNFFFHTGVRDTLCGMRAFRTEAWKSMCLQTGGMEFASEMVINAAKAGLKITQHPIAYHPRTGKTKLRTMRDGWRYLRFLLLYSPTHLFLIPGFTFMLMGLIVLSFLLPGPFPLFGHSWDIHTMILASVVTLIGLQIISLGLFARFFSLTEEIDGERDRLLLWLTMRFSLERGLVIGAMIFGLGFAVDSFILVKWIAENLGPLNEVRPAVFATTLIAVGTQIMFGSFFLSFLQFRKNRHKSDGLH